MCEVAHVRISPLGTLQSKVCHLCHERITLTDMEERNLLSSGDPCSEAQVQPLLGKLTMVNDPGRPTMTEQSPSTAEQEIWSSRRFDLVLN